MQLYLEDCSKVLKRMPSKSIDSIVTDPPYGINFMKQSWDQAIPQKEIWEECFRVLKPGGYILAFSFPRLYHHLASLMEKVGFNTQYMLAWIYGRGFPRGKNLSHNFDRDKKSLKPDEGFRQYLKEAIQKSHYKIPELEHMCGTKGMFGHYLGQTQPAFPNSKNWKIIKNALNLDNRYDDIFKKREEDKEKSRKNKDNEKSNVYFRGLGKKFEQYVPKSDLSKKWEGWRYGRMSLRANIEPIYFGQRLNSYPMDENIKKFGVGAININGCKVKGEDGRVRLPSSVMHDGSPEVVKFLTKNSSVANSSLNEFNFRTELDSPFFYVPKPNNKEREGNTHLTIKPVDLMRQLVRLVTPPNGVCLDPFMGSGTTGVACLMEGMDFCGIEMNEEYYKIAQNRLSSSYSYAS